MKNVHSKSRSQYRECKRAIEATVASKATVDGFRGYDRNGQEEGEVREDTRQDGAMDDGEAPNLKVLARYIRRW